MKTKKNIVTVVVVVVMLAVVSNSFARPSRQQRGRGGRRAPKVAVRQNHRHSPAVTWSYTRPHRRAGALRHRRNVFGYPHYRNRIVVTLPWLNAVFTPPRKTVVVTNPSVAETVIVWINNDNGSQSSVTLTRKGPGYIGQLGEYYQTMPTHEQLKMVYGLKREDSSW